MLCVNSGRFPVEKLVFADWPLKAKIILHERLAICTLDLICEAQSPTAKNIKQDRKNYNNNDSACTSPTTPSTHGISTVVNSSYSKPKSSDGSGKKSVNSMAIATSENYQLFDDKL